MLIGEEIKNHGGKFSMEARCWRKNQTHAGNELIKQVKTEWKA